MWQARRIPVIRQAESHECILACLAMICAWHGRTTPLADLRRRFPDLSRGGTLRDMIEIARALQLSGRAVRLDVEAIGNLRLPSILHWNFNHFVVLERVDRRGYHIVDPAVGRLVVSPENFSRQFTGIALELTPLPDFHHRGGDRRQAEARRRAILPLSAYRRPILTFVLISAAAMGFALITPLAVQIVVDQVIARNDVDLLMVVAGAFLSATIIGSLASYLQGQHIARQSARIRIHVTNTYIDQLAGHPAAYFLRRNLGTFVAQFNSLSHFVNFVVRNVGSMIIDALFALLISIILFFIDAAIAAIVLGINLFLIALRAALTRIAQRLQDNEVLARADEESYFVETMRGIASVKANSLEINRVGGSLDRTIEAANAAFALESFNLKYGFLIQSAKAVETIVTLYLLALAVMSGTMTVGVMYAFHAYRQILGDRLASLIDNMNDVLVLKVHRDRLAEVFRLGPEDAVPEVNIGRFMRFEGDIALDGIRYATDNGRKLVLDGFSARARPGEFVHVSGPTGSGKTTLLRIILGTLEPQSGSLCVDGIPITEKSLAILRNSVGAVLQEDTLFRGSVLENVALFDTDIDIARVEHCCRLAMIHDEIVRLPLGYQSEVGDIGSNLSTGQQQRLLLARAVYRKPSILIFDEATANLNADMERQILANIKALAVTTIFASHSANVRAVADRHWAIGPGGERPPQQAAQDAARQGDATPAG